MSRQPSARLAPVAGASARAASITIVAQVLARALTLGVTLVSTAIVAREVGVATYADWVTVLSLVALLAVALDPGMTPVIVRRLAQAPEDAPRPEAMRAVRLFLGAAAAVVVVFVTTILRGPHALLLAVALSAQAVPRALVLNATPWLQADQRVHRQTLLEATCAAVGLAGLAAASALGADATMLAVAGFLVPTALLAVLVRRELRRTPSYALPSPGPQRPKVVAVIREIAPLAGALVLTTLYTRLSAIFVNLAEDATGVARFLFAFQFVEQAIVAAGIVASALLPLLAARAGRVNLLRDSVTHDLCVAMVATGAVGTAALIALAGPLCRVIGGRHLAAAAHYLTLLSPMATIIMLAFTLGYLHVALGLGRRYLWINAVALALNLAAHATLTLSIGAEAAARVAWGTEAVVVTLAFVPLWRASRAGRAAGLRALLIFTLSVVAAELAAGAAWAPAVIALVLALLAVAVARQPLHHVVGVVIHR